MQDTIPKKQQYEIINNSSIALVELFCVYSWDQKDVSARVALTYIYSPHLQIRRDKDKDRLVSS